MFGLIVGFILGFIVATSGFTGLAASLDKGIDMIKTTSVSFEKVSGDKK